jgi:amidohydrolase
VGYRGIVSTPDHIRSAVAQSMAQHAADLISLSHDIWDHPELAFEEYYAAEQCVRVLTAAGFEVSTGIADLPTAFVAEIGSGPLVIAMCAELDALPDVGHACGHNMIAAAGVGAGLALASVADELGVTVRVYGTPAEEAGGGKILMLERGAFDGVHAAMMVHPTPSESDVFPTLASAQCDYRMHGRTAHSSMAPERGVNAADALTIGQVAVGLLRQHLEPGDQVHGIVTRGGEAANIVPGLAEATFATRAPSIERLGRLQPRIDRCFEAGALATGAELEVVSGGSPYSEFLHDDELAVRYRHHAEQLGRTFSTRPAKPAGSTDMANLSLLMPTIHPTLGLSTGEYVNHQPEFAAHCISAEADQAVLDGAAAMALTAADAASVEPLRARLLDADTDYGQRATYPWSR